MAGLTVGAIEALFDNQTDSPLLQGPVLQIVNIKALPANSNNPNATPRYRLLISDGNLYTQAMLSHQMNHLFANGSIQKNTVVKLTQFLINTVERLVDLLDFEIIDHPVVTIGNPQNIQDARNLCSSNSNAKNKSSASLLGQSPSTQGVSPQEENMSTKRNICDGIEYNCILGIKRLPEKGNRNILVTSALPYVNNEPHLGNIIGCVLSADAFARYCRLRNYNVIYICGTDEYGTATETKALEEGVSCKSLCDKYYQMHKSIYEFFNIEFDHFGRTTTEWQTKIAQDIFLKLHKNGQLFEQTMSQLYCGPCKRFLADRYVEGTCPFCGYDDARGDQCDACQKLINATELINPRCKVSGDRPEMKDSKHIFINLPGIQQKCEEFVKNSSIKGKWTSNSISITNGWLKEGLKPRCITRDLKWGTPVPLDSMPDKVFYVWFDAPIGYLSITANYIGDDWEKWWKNPSDVQLYQFMGKDNIPFHTVIFPCSLLGTGEDYTLLHHVSTTEYLNYENGKFSKSRKTGVFGSNVKDTGIPVDVWRYYLFGNRPETNDSAFSWRDFIARNNNELLANFGNFVNRILKFLASPKYNSTIPSYSIDSSDTELISNINQLISQYIEALENVKLRSGLQFVMNISARGNQYLQDNKLDNNLFLNHTSRCNNVVATAVNLAYTLAPLIQPYMPETAANLCKQLNAPLRQIPTKFEFVLLEGHMIGQPNYLFKKIDEKMEDVYRTKYGSASGAHSSPGKPVATVAGKKGTKGKKSSPQDPIKLIESYEGEIPNDITLLKDETLKQGEVVRKLKADKADAEKVKEEVDRLLQLKQDLLEKVTKLVGQMKL